MTDRVTTHMLIHELSEAECRELLARKTLGRLACSRSNQPYITPISFYFDPGGDCLYSFSIVGQKIDWMRANPKVCVEVEDLVDKLHWTTVVVFGNYREVSDSRADTHLRHRANQLFQERPGWWLPATGKLAAGEEHSAPVVYRIMIERVTGRRAMRPQTVG